MILHRYKKVSRILFISELLYVLGLQNNVMLNWPKCNFWCSVSWKILSAGSYFQAIFLVDTSYWLGRSWGYCRLSLQKGWKYQNEANNLNNRRQISMFCWGTAEICHGAVNFTVLLTPPTQWMENEEHFLKVGFIQRVLAKFSISNHMNIALKLFPINSTNKTLVTFWIHLHLFPDLRTIWFLEKTGLSEIRVSGTVLMFQLTRNSPTCA